MSDKIRVVRVLEYEYPNVEAMDADRAQWTDHTPPLNNRVTMRTVGILVTPADA